MTDIIISCVVPAYNAQKHLPGLDKMLAAQEKGGWEVVFVDDGSTDGSGGTLDKICAGAVYEARVIHQKNAGVSAARNAGMDAARGRYVAFLDADDGIAPDYMAVMKRRAEADRELTVFDHSRVVEGDFRFDIKSRAAEKIAPQEMLDDFIVNPTGYGVYDFLIRRDLTMKPGVRFPEGFPYYEDYDFTLKLLSSAEDICRAGECVYCYRAAAGSAMSTFNVKRIESLKLFENGYSLCIEKYPEVHKKFRKWFVARICWSIIWQAGVSMNVREAVELARSLDARRHMKNLTDHPDRRVSLSARVYLISPYTFIRAMSFMGRRRTLISGS